MVQTTVKWTGQNLELGIETDFNEIGLLKKLAAALLGLGWNIIAADLRTGADNRVHDQFLLKPARAGGNSHENFLDIGEIVDTVLSGQVTVEDIMRKYNVSDVLEPASVTDAGPLISEIVYENAPDEGGVKFVIETPDRRGLLFALASVFAADDMDIRSATIRTNLLNGHAEDTFIVRDKNGELFGGSPLAEKVRQDILGRLAK